MTSRKLLSGSNNYLPVERDIIRERLRQARLSFNLVVALMTVSATISIMGAGLLLSGRISEGAAMTAEGFASNAVNVRLLKLTQEANDWLNKMAKDLKDSN